MKKQDMHQAEPQTAEATPPKKAWRKARLVELDLEQTETGMPLAIADGTSFSSS